MNSDIRVNTGFLHHPKTRLLRRRLGGDAVLALQQLWCYCAEYKPTGDLSGMSDDSIEAAAEWTGEPGMLIRNLTDRETRFIDGKEGNRTVHDWLDHNPYAAGSISRSDKQRFKRLAGAHPHIYNQLAEKGVFSLSAEAYQQLTSGSTTVDQWLTGGQPKPTAGTTPYPSPVPLPVPSPSAVDQAPVDAQDITHGIDPDRITSDTPLPPTLQHEWDQLLAVYPKPNGIVKGKDPAVRIWVRHHERARALKNARNYAAAAPEIAMNLDRFLREGYRDYDTAPTPSGHDGLSPPQALIAALRLYKAMPPGLPGECEALLRKKNEPWQVLRKQVLANQEVTF